jgi:hypothetical protein
MKSNDYSVQESRYGVLKSSFSRFKHPANVSSHVVLPSGPRPRIVISRYIVSREPEKDIKIKPNTDKQVFSMYR